MITIDQYLMGRDKKYPQDFNAVIRDNAADTVQRVNQLLGKFYRANPKEPARGVTSGWRPAAVNAAIKGSAKASLHMQAKACDMADTSGALDSWLMTEPGQLALTDCGLWHEHPRDTPGWAHVQTKPPASGRRTFYAR